MPHPATRGDGEGKRNRRDRAIAAARTRTPPYGAHARAPAGHTAAWSPPRAGTAKTRGSAFFGPSKHTRVGEPVNAAAHAAGRRGVAS